jgi:hypothetical protein
LRRTVWWSWRDSNGQPCGYSDRSESPPSNSVRNHTNALCSTGARRHANAALRACTGSVLKLHQPVGELVPMEAEGRDRSRSSHAGVVRGSFLLRWPSSHQASSRQPFTVDCPMGLASPPVPNPRPVQRASQVCLLGDTGYLPGWELPCDETVSLSDEISTKQSNVI